MRYKNTLYATALGIIVFLLELTFSTFSEKSLELIMRNLAERGQFVLTLPVMMAEVFLGSFSPWSLGLFWSFVFLLVLKVSESLWGGKYKKMLSILFLILFIFLYSALFLLRSTA